MTDAFDSDEGATHFFGDGCSTPHGRIGAGLSNVVPLAMPIDGPEMEALLDSAQRHPSRNWRHAAAGNTLSVLVSPVEHRFPRRNISFGMTPGEAHHIYDAVRADRVTLACWCRRLVLAELRRRGVSDGEMPWLVASCAIPDQRHTFPPATTRQPREVWT